MGIDAVEVGIAGIFDEADGACPEAASRVALAIVEAVGGTLGRFGIGQGCPAAGLGVKAVDSAVARTEVIARCGGHDRPDAFAHGVDGLDLSRSVELDEAVAFDVHVDEFILPPDGAFAPA